MSRFINHHPQSRVYDGKYMWKAENVIRIPNQQRDYSQYGYEVFEKANAYMYSKQFLSFDNIS